MFPVFFIFQIQNIFAEKGNPLLDENHYETKNNINTGDACDGRDNSFSGYDGACNVGGPGFSAFVKLIQKVIGWVIEIAFYIAVLSVFYAGFLFLTANGGDKISKAKSVLWNALIGLVIIGAAFIIVQTVYKLLGIGGWDWLENVV